MAKKNIVITGVRGFIGAHLCNKLIEYGHNVIGIDNQICPSATKFYTSKPFRYILGDVCYPETYMKFLPYEIDEIYHLASIASPPIYKQYPFETIMTNVNGTINMCKLAKNRGAKLLLSSTSEVYGRPPTKNHPQIETYNGNVDTLSKRAPYDESKRMAETVVNTFSKDGLNATIVRIFNTYGPGMALNDGRFIVEFTKRVLEERDVVIYNGGSQTRSPCYIDDMIKMLINAMDIGGFGPYNIGNDKEYSVKEILNMIMNIIGKNPNIVHMPLYDGDPARRKPDLSRANLAEISNFKKTQIYDGLKKTITYIRRQID